MESWKQYEGQVAAGQFHLIRYLGHSENSAVFLTGGVDSQTPRAAIKLVLATPENGEEQLSRWERAAKLSHPHLIRLYSMGRCQLGEVPLLYLAMEYAGENLAEALTERPLTAEETRQMLSSAVDALAYLHREGFVHGGLKPANILAVEDRLKLSSDGVLRAEESAGLAVTPSPAADVWSLGATMVEALTQHPPVEGLQLPAPFGDIAEHCLERDPQRRWTVADIAARLQGTSNAPRKPAAAEKPAASHGRYVWAGGAICLVLAAVLLRPILFNCRPAPQRPATILPVDPPVQPSPPRESAAPEAGRVPRKVVQEVLPQVPRKASDSIQGKVGVRVLVSVDQSGKVTAAKLDSPGPSRYFAGLALDAAKKWRFEPANVDDPPAAWIIRFEFRRDGIKAYPARAAR